MCLFKHRALQLLWEQIKPSWWECAQGMSGGLKWEGDWCNKWLLCLQSCSHSLGCCASVYLCNLCIYVYLCPGNSIPFISSLIPLNWLDCHVLIWGGLCMGKVQCCSCKPRVWFKPEAAHPFLLLLLHPFFYPFFFEIVTLIIKYIKTNLKVK